MDRALLEQVLDSMRVKCWAPVVVKGEVWEGFIMEDESFIPKWRSNSCRMDQLFHLGLNGKVIKGKEV